MHTIHGDHIPAVLTSTAVSASYLCATHLRESEIQQILVSLIVQRLMMHAAALIELRCNGYEALRGVHVEAETCNVFFSRLVLSITGILSL